MTRWRYAALCSGAIFFFFLCFCFLRRLFSGIEQAVRPSTTHVRHAHALRLLRLLWGSFESLRGLLHFAFWWITIRAFFSSYIEFATSHYLSQHFTRHDLRVDDHIRILQFETTFEELAARYLLFWSHSYGHYRHSLQIHFPNTTTRFFSTFDRHAVWRLHHVLAVWDVFLEETRCPIFVVDLALGSMLWRFGGMELRCGFRRMEESLLKDVMVWISWLACRAMDDMISPWGWALLFVWSRQSVEKYWDVYWLGKPTDGGSCFGQGRWTALRKRNRFQILVH